MRVSRKLFMGFSVIICFAIAVGVIGISGMQRLRAANLLMYEKQVRGLEYVGKAATVFKQIRLDSRQVVISSFLDDKKGAQDAERQFEENIVLFKHWMQESYKVSTTLELTKFHDKIMTLFESGYLPEARRLIADSIADIPDHHNRLYVKVTLASISHVTDRIESLMIGLMELNAALAAQTSIDNTWITQRYIFLQTLLLIVSMVVAAVVTLYIIKSISEPINESAFALERIAEGDFDARVRGDYRGDFGIIKDSVNHTAKQLSSYLNEKLKAEQAAHESILEKVRVEAASEAVFAGIEYASKIQRSVLPPEHIFENAFSEYSIIWKPRDIVGGDIYWIKQFPEGTILCVCDCTGHGTPGALLTMLVVSTLEAVVRRRNYQDTAEIIWQLEKRLVEVFNMKTDERKRTSDIKDGCDIAVLFVSKDGSVKLSAGNISVFICDGKEMKRIKGQKIYVGEGLLNSKDDIKTIHIPANPENKFYIASDGLFDQPGGAKSLPFGYKRFGRILMENHNEKQAAISDLIWQEFETFRGKESRVDDFELITFKP